VGLWTLDRCLEGRSAFPVGTRVDELRTTVGVAADVAVAMMVMMIVVDAAPVQERFFARYNNFSCTVDHFLISSLGRFQSSCAVSGMSYCSFRRVNKVCSSC